MYKKTIKYTDYNGVEREEDFYFNINKAELMDKQFSVKGGWFELIDRITKAKDNAELIKLFREVIHMSYGVKSEDGKRFIKNQEVLDEFIQCPAYSELYMKLATDDKAATAFISHVFPADIVAKAQEMQKNGTPVIPSST
jgi:hypothetical protein